MKPSETPQEAARRLADDVMRRGFEAQGLHLYTDATGRELFYKIRAKDPATGEKWLRPMHINGAGYYKLGEPEGLAPKPLYRLDLLAKEPTATVWIVEGERAADALNSEFRRLKLSKQNVASTSGSADSAQSADWSPVRGRRVVIWPDNDEPGKDYGKNVHEALNGLGCEIVLISVDGLGLPAKGDFVDFKALHPDISPEDLLRLPRERVSSEKEPPRPLYRTISPGTPFPIDALGPLLGLAAKKAHEVIQAPEALCAQTFLAAATLAVQCQADVEVDGRIMPVSGFFVTVAESGERKSAVDRYALEPHRLFQGELRDKASAEAIAYEREKTVWTAAREQALRGAKGLVAKRQAVEELGPPPVPPLHPLLLIEEPTFEGLIKLLEFGQPGIGLFSDEGGRFISGHGMNDDNRMKTAAGLCSLWDGKAVTKVRAGEGAAIFSGKRLSVHLMVQPEVAARMLSNRELEDQGLLSRLLVCSPVSTAGTRRYREVDLGKSQELQRYNSRLAEIMRRPAVMAEGKQNELSPRRLKLSRRAKESFIAFHDEVERELAPTGAYESIRGFANKAAEHAVRMAGVLMLVEDLSCIEIDAERMTCGIMLAKFYLSEALRLFETGRIEDNLREAEQLLAWLHSRDHNVVSLVEIYQCSIKSARSARPARALMSVLVEHGWAIPIEGGVEFNGTIRKDAWRIVRQ